MKPKRLFLAMAFVLAAAGLWFARSGSRAHAPQESGDGIAAEGPQGLAKPGQALRPPDPARRFSDFTPEQRVKFARKGHGPGG